MIIEINKEPGITRKAIYILGPKVKRGPITLNIAS